MSKSWVFAFQPTVLTHLWYRLCLSVVCDVCIAAKRYVVEGQRW